MIRMKLTRTLFMLVLLPALASAAKPKQMPDHWVGTWSTGNIGVDSHDPDYPSGRWLPGAVDSTLRQVVHTSLAGPQVRLTFTNAFGTDPLTLGEVHIALAAPARNLFGKPSSPGGALTGNIALASANALTFNGQRSITIPAGAEVTSDPVVLALPANADLIVSLFLAAQQITILTEHPGAYQSNFIAPGNVVRLKSIAPDSTSLVPPAATATATASEPLTSWFFLKSVDVLTSASDSAIVAFGDSITDGYASTPNTNQRWPDLLARRLNADKATATYGILNEGISGNRILHDSRGPNALSRFDRDVLAQSGVSTVILLEGINDIGVAFDTRSPHPPVKVEELEAGLAQLAAKAHAHNLRVLAGTLTAYMGCDYASPAGEQVRESLNAWIRTVPNTFDGVIDFDQATQDPANANSFNPAFDHGDHLHPSDAGMKAMAAAINLQLLSPKS